MEKYIPKSALVAEIEKLELCTMDEHMNYYSAEAQGEYNALSKLEFFIDTLEVKVDLEKVFNDEYSKFSNDVGADYAFPIDLADFKDFAKHFFELGMRINNPVTAADRGTAEEIIINLKRVEQDYRINLTKEIEWLRNKVKKGEEV